MFMVSCELGIRYKLIGCQQRHYDFYMIWSEASAATFFKLHFLKFLHINIGIKKYDYLTVILCYYEWELYYYISELD